MNLDLSRQNPVGLLAQGGEVSSFSTGNVVLQSYRNPSLRDHLLQCCRAVARIGRHHMWRVASMFLGAATTPPSGTAKVGETLFV
jgi:hypothetical protein